MRVTRLAHMCNKVASSMAAVVLTVQVVSILEPCFQLSHLFHTIHTTALSFHTLLLFLFLLPILLCSLASTILAVLLAHDDGDDKSDTDLC